MNSDVFVESLMLLSVAATSLSGFSTIVVIISHAIYQSFHIYFWTLFLTCKQILILWSLIPILL